jgi:hypothetical protein
MENLFPKKRSIMDSVREVAEFKEIDLPAMLVQSMVLPLMKKVPPPHPITFEVWAGIVSKYALQAVTQLPDWQNVLHRALRGTEFKYENGLVSKA